MARYWFKPRRYGHGATPVTWEGWMLTIGVAPVIVLSIVTMNLLADRSNVVAWLLWAAFIAAVAFLMVHTAGNEQMANGAGAGVSVPVTPKYRDSAFNRVRMKTCRFLK